MKWGALKKFEFYLVRRCAFLTKEKSLLLRLMHKFDIPILPRNFSKVDQTVQYAGRKVCFFKKSYILHLNQLSIFIREHFIPFENDQAQFQVFCFIKTLLITFQMKILSKILSKLVAFSALKCLEVLCIDNLISFIILLEISAKISQALSIWLFLLWYSCVLNVE